MPLTTLSSDSSGKVRFTDIGTTNAVLYSIEAGSGKSFEVLVERLEGELLVSWPTGILQRATSLSPPNWENVPLSNGPLRVNLSNALPMKNFRLFKP